MLRASGYEDGAALTLQSTDGEIPQGRELSFAWLAGTVMTGLTSVVLMGAALYMAFLGQDTFSTPFHALQIETAGGRLDTPADKTDRLKPIIAARSEREIIDASIRVDDEGISRIRRQPFDRIRATLATVATNLSSDIPAWDPVALLNRTQTQTADPAELISTDIYGAEVDGEITVTNVALTLDAPPAPEITDQAAAEFVRLVAEGIFVPGDTSLLGYAAEPNTSVIDLGTTTEFMLSSVAENVTVLPQTTTTDQQTLGRSERILTIREPTTLRAVLTENGYSEADIAAVLNALAARGGDVNLPEGYHLRILFGPNRTQESLIPYRTSIYNAADEHLRTIALTDSGQYVLGQPPAPIEFPEEDTEQVNVNNLPSIYRSIWETGRKYGLPDEDIDRIVAMYAYDLDLTRRINPGDGIELLLTVPEETSDPELLYVALTLDGVQREFFRYQTEDGEIDFYDQDGETGKRFLTRRPLQGGGNLRSRFGYRRHPIFGDTRLHTGIDLSAPTGTPIYASGDGIVERASWFSGYGRYVEIRHVNGYETAYGHMSRIADGMAPGVAVRQGQVIGYVGSTGQSTGPHLHFEIKVNGRVVDPLSVRLPRDKTLPARDQIAFGQTVQQIRDLMDREIEPEITIASTQ